jgi:hypothetical protein
MNNSVRTFHFYTSQPLVELTDHRASNLGQLLRYLKEVDGSSIYFHTHHYVREHHFLSNEYPSDFAFWVAEILRERELGEKLAIIDVRSYPSIRALREKLIEVVENYLQENGKIVDVHAGLEFHFRKTLSIIVPTGESASTIPQLKTCLAMVDLNSIYYHLVEYRIREENVTNDFSQWIRDNFDKEILASAIERIDPYYESLEECRQKIVEILGREERKQRLQEQFVRYPSTGVADTLKEKGWFKKLKYEFQKAWYQE